MRCLIVLVDGLRPDAVTSEHAPSLSGLSAEYCWALAAQTVCPSVTVAALASLATGVAPESHGFLSPGTGFLTRMGRLSPLCRELGRREIPTQVIAGAAGVTERALAGTLLRFAGVSHLHTTGVGAEATVRSALPRIRALRRGLSVIYLADCDRAGHAHGWMTPPYLAALRGVDRGVALLEEFLDDSLIIIMSDHGGGGVEPRDHDIEHPVNRRITLMFAGPEVAAGERLSRPVSLLDVPPTVLDYFGVPVPRGYEGRVIEEAVAQRKEAVA